MTKLKTCICIFLATFSLIMPSACAEGETSFIIDNAGVLMQGESCEAQARELYDEKGIVFSLIIERDGEGGMLRAQKLYTELFGDAPGIMLLDALEDESICLFSSPPADPIIDETQAAMLIAEYDAQADFDDAVFACIDAAEDLFEKNKAKLPETENTKGIALLGAEKLFDNNAKTLIEAQADSIFAQYGCRVFAIIDQLSIEQMRKSLREGEYDAEQAVFLLLSSSDNSYEIISTVELKKVFSEEAKGYIAEKYIGSLENGIGEDAVKGFFQGCEELFYAAQKGDYIEDSHQSSMSLILIIAAIIIPAAALIYLFNRIMKRKVPDEQE